jgi:hypothetical protein
VVRRAGGGAQALHLLHQKRQQSLGIQQRFGLLVEAGLVGRAAALGDEEELVLVAVGRVEVDLRRQVGAGVPLLVQIQRRRLRVAQAVGGVGVEDAPGEGLFVAAAGEHPGALLGHDSGGAGVLAERKPALGRDQRVLEHGPGHVAVVLRRPGVLEDGGHAGVVRLAQEERGVVHRSFGEIRQACGLYDQDFLAVEPLNGDELTCQQLVLGVVLSEAGEGLVRKVDHLSLL